MIYFTQNGIRALWYMSQFCVFCKSNNYKVTDVSEVIHCILLAQRASGSDTEDRACPLSGRRREV